MVVFYLIIIYQYHVLFGHREDIPYPNRNILREFSADGHVTTEMLGAWYKWAPKPSQEQEQRSSSKEKTPILSVHVTSASEYF